ncbi:hypothetical protein M758_9G069200 [Ceratodon purpureus]|nr:hypothetical protein M758_9G069200 [Ceratodon purpureus]
MEFLKQLVRCYVVLGLIAAVVHQCHSQLHESFVGDEYFPDGTVAPLSRRSLLDNPKVRAVSLGGWLVIEKWIKPSLFDGIPDSDLLDGARINLQSTSKETFVSAEGGGGGQMVVNRAAISTWETFKIWRVSTGVYQLRVFNNMFVSAIKGGGGSVQATAANPSTWETFHIIRNQANPSMVHIQANNGMYLQAKDANQLTADFQGKPGWDNNDATFIMKVSTWLGGEYQLANGWGASAPDVFKKHRDSFIQEGDFWFLSKNGINTVRIPVGWWIASDPNPPAPYVSGSLQALDNAFQWANAHGIKVLIDLHAAPGSQNGQEHSSSRDGVAEWAEQGGSTDYLYESIKTIDFLAGRYANNQALFGIELLNEPGAAVVPLNVLEYYYKWGYSTVRKHTASAYVIMCQRIGGDFAELVNVLPADKVVLDIHFYNLFNTNLFGKTSAQWNIDYVYRDRLGLVKKLNTAGNALIFVGEWTNEWEVKAASQSDYQKFGAAQLEVFGQATFGWAYWSYQNQLSHWSFKQSVQQGYLQPPSDGWL